MTHQKMAVMWAEDRFERLMDYKERERRRKTEYELMRTGDNEASDPRGFISQPDFGPFVLLCCI